MTITFSNWWGSLKCTINQVTGIQWIVGYWGQQRTYWTVSTKSRPKNAVFLTYVWNGRGLMIYSALNWGLSGHRFHLSLFWLLRGRTLQQPKNYTFDILWPCKVDAANVLANKCLLTQQHFCPLDGFKFKTHSLPLSTLCFDCSDFVCVCVYCLVMDR